MPPPPPPRVLALCRAKLSGRPYFRGVNMTLPSAISSSYPTMLFMLSDVEPPAFSTGALQTAVLHAPQGRAAEGCCYVASCASTHLAARPLPS